MPAKLRLRHPKGVSTLTVDLESPDATVQDLLNQIFGVSEIMPSQQELKIGYPPTALEAVIPELPLSSLGIKSGDQIMVTQKSGAPPINQSTRPTAPPLPAEPRGVNTNPPASLPPPSAPSSNKSGLEYVSVEGGYLVHRIVPDDNSCLFASVALVLEQDIGKAQTIRKVVGDAIRKDPGTWTEAMLGRPPEEYIRVITSKDSWGGAIELSILASYYSTEIASIDVETGRIDNFTPTSGVSSGNCVLLIYSGIHYDAAILKPALDVPDDFSTTVFNSGNPQILAALKQLADKLRKKRMYTNTATFDLKCEDCGQGLKGEKGAREHASQTGHVRFGEYH
ncbi:unnamed protein product [Peniophora sp. CBMAI 1063]|nr:unnamed protein product [Peniophora sp. CBMAI 1063]